MSKNFSSILSFKKEILFITFTFVLVLSIPFIAVILLTQSGFEIISDRLVSVNKQNHSIRLNYPNGSFYKELELDTIWPANGYISLEFGKPALYAVSFRH